MAIFSINFNLRKNGYKPCWEHVMSKTSSKKEWMQCMQTNNFTWTRRHPKTHQSYHSIFYLPFNLFINLLPQVQFSKKWTMKRHACKRNWKSSNSYFTNSRKWASPTSWSEAPREWASQSNHRNKLANQLIMISCFVHLLTSSLNINSPCFSLIEGSTCTKLKSWGTVQNSGGITEK